MDELREYAMDTDRTAWSRKDGGQELTMLAALADKAADRIEALEAEARGEAAKSLRADGELHEALARIAALEAERDSAIRLAEENWSKLVTLDQARIAAEAERERLQALLDSRPAINAALPGSYIAWSQNIYVTEARRALDGGEG